MTLLHKTALLLAGICAGAVATISEWELDNSDAYLQTDSIGYTYASTRDTTVSYIFYETGGDAVLDTNSDSLLYAIYIVDNGSRMHQEGHELLFPDADTADGRFRFSPGRAEGLPPSLYHVILADADTVLADTFRVEAVPDPYRTVSGTVIPPAGMAVRWIRVEVALSEARRYYAAFTDAGGAYTVALDTAVVQQGNGRIEVHVQTTYEGYICDPVVIEDDLTHGNATDMDFAFVEPGCRITGTLTELESGAGIENAEVYIAPAQGGPDVGSDETDANGVYGIPCAEGAYTVGVNSWDIRTQYMYGSDSTITIAQGETLTVDMSLAAADAWIHGRVTVEGASTGAHYALSAWESGVGSNWDTTNSDGYFSIPVSMVADTYWVQPSSWGVFDSLPDGYVMEHGQQWKKAAPGDSVYFNLVEEPPQHTAAPGHAASTGRTALLQTAYDSRTNTVTCSYTIAGPVHIRLALLTVNGRTVSVLADRFVQPGMYTLEYTVDMPRSSHVYILRMEAGGATFSRIVPLVR